MDGRIFKVMKKVCLFLFASDIFVHAVIGASLINGVVKGAASMAAMLLLLIILTAVDRNRRIRKDREKRQEEDI